MVDRPQLEDYWRRTLEANLRYYEALGRLSVDYLRAVAGALGDLRRTQTGGVSQAPRDLRRTQTGGVSQAPPSRPDPSASSARAAQPAPAMVLEAEAGAGALGAFLVENLLSSRVSAPIVASAFTNPAGREVRPRLAFDPDVVTLEPGEQVLVRVVAAIEAELEPEVGYRGEISVPGLTGTRIPIVLRRRPPQPSRARRLPKSKPASAPSRPSSKVRRPRG